MLQIDFMANLLSVVLSKSVIALVHHPILLFRKHHINLDGHVHALMFMFSSSLQYRTISRKPMTYNCLKKLTCAHSWHSFLFLTLETKTPQRYSAPPRMLNPSCVKREEGNKKIKFHPSL